MCIISNFVYFRKRKRFKKNPDFSSLERSPTMNLIDTISSAPLDVVRKYSCNTLTNEITIFINVQHLSKGS